MKDSATVSFYYRQYIDIRVMVVIGTVYSYIVPGAIQ